jgi:hypothetical protein
MMALDLTSIEGLTDEQAAAINALHDDDVSGLKAKRTELLQREKEAKTKADAAEQAKIEADEQAKINLAEQEKDFEGLKTALAEKDARIAEQDKANRDFADNQLLSASKAEFMALVSDDPAAKHYMESKFNASTGVRDGQVVPVNAEGGVTGQSLNELIASIQSDTANAAYMRSNAGSGGSAAGSSDTSGSSASFSDMTKTEQSVFLNKHPEKAAQLLNH